MKRLLAQPLALATAGIAVAGILATTGLLVAIYLITGEAPVGRRSFSGLMTWVWATLPYLLNIVGAIYFARWRRSSIVLLIATIAVTALVAVAVTLGLLHPSSTASIMFLVLPMYQAIGILVGLWIALVMITPDERNRHRSP